MNGDSAHELGTPNIAEPLVECDVKALSIGCEARTVRPSRWTVGVDSHTRIAAERRYRPDTAPPVPVASDEPDRRGIFPYQLVGSRIVTVRPAPIDTADGALIPADPLHVALRRG